MVHDHFRQFEDLGAATPFVARLVEIVEHITVFAQFERAEIEALARYLHCYRAPAGVSACAASACN